MFRRIARPLLAAVFVNSGIDALRNPEPRAKLATGNYDWLGVRRNGKYVLGRPRLSTVMPEEPAASPDHAGDVLGEVLLVESRMEQPP